VNVLKVYTLDLNEFGELTKRLLVDVYEDGRVEGDSFLAEFLSNTIHNYVHPVSLDYLQKLYTNGYYAAEIVSLDFTSLDSVTKT
jgi:hypothetical protein